MIYARRDGVVIRDLEPGDPAQLAAAERAQGWQATEDKYLDRLRDRDAGRCVALAAELDGAPVGYVNLYFEPLAGPFRGIPEIVDFGVLERCRRRGVGTLLMDVAEDLAAGRADRVCLAVGLHGGYGSAQRMYVKRGYVFDGSGAWYRDAPCPPYAPCANDDDLVLYMVKEVRGRGDQRDRLSPKPSC